MDLWQQRHDVLVKQAFGPWAVRGGSIGTATRPGDIRIMVDGRTIGSGRTFQSALADVTHRNTIRAGGQADGNPNHRVWVLVRGRGAGLVDVFH